MGNTPIFNFPYPEPTDLVRDGAQNFEDLADAVETTISTLPTGPILQIVTAKFVGGNFTTTSGSFVATGFKASITPQSATSKLIINFYNAIRVNRAAGTIAERSGQVRIIDNTAVVVVADEAVGRDLVTTSSVFAASFAHNSITVVVDSSSTSIREYELHARSLNATNVQVFINATATRQSSIVITEVE